MKIFVTGATGFVGRPACRHFVAAGHEVIAGYNRAPPLVEPGIKWVQTRDLSRSSELGEALDGVEVLVHLAALAHVNASRDKGDLIRLTNQIATLNVAREAAAAGIRRFVFLSSVKACAESSIRPISEDDPLHPEDSYGEAKRLAEEGLREIGAQTGMHYVVIRPPLVYGPGVKANFLSLLRAVDRGIPLPVASIANKRSLIFVGNLVDAIETCIRHPRAADRTYFVSDNEDVSTPELAAMIAAALRRPSRLLPCPYALLRVLGRITGCTGAIARLTQSLQVDISRIQAELGWKPRFTLQEGLAETASWYASQKA